MNVFRNPLIFGASFGILVIISNILIASLAEGSLKGGYSIFLDNGIFTYLIPLAVGLQMGLFRYHRNLISGKHLIGSEKIGMAGSTTSSVAMIACCLHHVNDLLPAAGFLLAASSFLIDYKEHIIVFGLIANVVGSAYITRAILKERQIYCRS
jgi:hypothetical protein